MAHSHIQQAREVDPGFDIPENPRVSGRAKFWIALGVLLAGGVAAWTRMELRVDRIEEEQKEFRTLVREVRDASQKLGANAEAMQRQLDRMDRMGR